MCVWHLAYLNSDFFLQKVMDIEVMGNLGKLYTERYFFKGLVKARPK